MNEVEPCPICGGIISHRIGCPWWRPPDDDSIQDEREDEQLKAAHQTLSRSRTFHDHRVVLSTSVS